MLSASLPGVLAAAAFGYLLGSIPFGLVLTRAAGMGDIRAIGSGNIGATNVLRTGNKGLAAATLLFDAFKGTVAALVAGQFGFDYAIAAGVGAFLGHIFPVWLGFKGGKGVATFIGVLLGLYWPAAVVFCLAWLIVAFLSRYSSLSALTASVAATLATWWPPGIGLSGTSRIAAPAADPRLWLVFAALTALIFIKHHQNIAKLLAGTESRIGEKSAPPPTP